MSDMQIQLNKISQEKEVSNWLTSDPISKHGLNLNKQQLWNGIGITYGWELINIPSICACGHKMDMQRAISCKKGGSQQCTRFNMQSVNYYMYRCGD